jgi:amino-acid N-acetyltransferase
VSELIIRDATVEDVDAIGNLVNGYANEGMMLPKSMFKIYSKLQSYHVAEEDNRVVACVSLVLLWKDLAEICSLAVDKNYVKRGIGKLLVTRCIEKAKSLKVQQLIVLTYQDGFFERIGFHFVDKDTFPRKLMWECLECPKLDDCDERAYLIELS